MKQTKPRRLLGMTLIELVIYTALVSVIGGFFFFASSGYITSAERDREQAETHSNQLFLEQKIHALLNGAGSGTVIPATSSGSALGVLQPNSTYAVIRLNQGRVYSSTASGVSNDQLTGFSNDVPITNSKVTVTALTFTRQTINGQPAMHVAATLQGKYKAVTINKTEYIE